MNVRLRLRERAAGNPPRVQRALRLLGLLIGIALVYFSRVAGQAWVPVIVFGMVLGFRNAGRVREKATDPQPTLPGVLHEELRGLVRVLALSCLLAGLAWMALARGSDRWYGLIVAAAVSVAYTAYACRRGLSDDGAVTALLAAIALTAGGAVGVATAQGTGWVAALSCLSAGIIMLVLLAHSLWSERRQRRLEQDEQRQTSLRFKPCRTSDFSQPGRALHCLERPIRGR